MIAYKFTSQGAVGRYSGFSWPRPTGDQPGAWVEVAGPLQLATNGVHACRLDQLPYWIDRELWEVEFDDPVEDTDRSLISRRGRLLRPIYDWTRDAAQDFVADCGVRSRAHATAALVACGEDDRAAELEAAHDPAQYMGAAVSAAEQLPGPFATILLDSADVAFATHGGMSTCLVAYLAARVARTAAEATEEFVPEADLAERHAQARWLAERLKLSVMDGTSR